ncbi:MAG: hypothetical protein H6Q28_1739 [Bacteroidetes bacterium]|nr:hypothetical protein [Bacteroidota bacterium]
MVKNPVSSSTGEKHMDDFGRAFSFPFRDPQWFVKFLIGSLMCLLCVVGVGFFILAGYFIQITQRAIRNDEPGLPDWSGLGDKFVMGVKIVIVYLVYLLPVILLMIPLLPLAVLTERPEAGDLIGLFSLVYFFGFTLLIVPYSIALTIASPIINYRFALNERIGDALDIGAIIRDFGKNWQNVLVVVLITIGVQSFAWIGVVLFLVGVLFTILYSYMVPAYLSGLLHRDTIRKERVV